MNTEIKAKWVEALRSGQFKQGTDRLHNKQADTYCCLGVLRAVHAIPKAMCHEILDTAAAGEIGLALDEQQKLADMNDTGCSFELIAEHIEKYL